jgi:UDP-N-acetylmuramate dehydrogenase
MSWLKKPDYWKDMFELSQMSRIEDLDHQTETLHHLSKQFGISLLLDCLLARYTSSRLGGPATALIEARTVYDLVEAVSICWEEDFPFRILGGGSNVLVSEKGFSGLVIVNRSSQIRFKESGSQPEAWAESGVNFGLLARLAAQRGLSGLEWAASIPGTLGGAVVGNAGAFGSDIAGNLILAKILHHTDSEICQEDWIAAKMDYDYRSSVLKRNPGKDIVLSGSLRLERSTPEAVQEKLEENITVRKRTQPPGASMGSMFKNPPGDFAGRLIEAAGLKGHYVGGAQISPMHANFFVNQGNATAQDYYQLIKIVRERVAEEFGIQLELEVELMGEW